MKYTLELSDHAGLRRARIDNVPLLEITRGGVDGEDSIRGLLPPELQACAPGWVVRVLINDTLVAEAPVRTLEPEWGDARKLILDRYLSFNTVIQFEATPDPGRFSTHVSRSFLHTRIDELVRSLINHATGPLHYTVAHNAYPEGAQREYAKLLSRTFPENELEVGGIAEGQWVASTRIDLTSVYAKDGDTLAGLRVDGEDWPDLRLMMIDCEEMTRNSHAITRHPEVATWTDVQYERSVYYQRAMTARDFLQDLLDTHGISHIELNPHRDHTGAFDDRVDAYGRYLGLVFGGGRCYNAALVEENHADIYLYANGNYLDPELALKEFYSYQAPCDDSISPCDTVLSAFHADAPVLELVATLAYAAPAFAFHLTHSGAVHFQPADSVHRVYFYDALRHTAATGAQDNHLANVLTLGGNPLLSQERVTRSRGESTAHYGSRYRALAHHAFSSGEDLEALAQGLLDDLAYPGYLGELTLFSGDPHAVPGQSVELRGYPLRRLHDQLDEEHGGRFPEKIAARIHGVRHRIHGRHLSTTLTLGAPLRSVRQPLSFLTQSQRTEAQLYAFRLDDEGIALDLGLHLD